MINSIKSISKMREIKFRGWFQGINGIEMWVYGYLVKQTNGNWGNYQWGNILDC